MDDLERLEKQILELIENKEFVTLKRILGTINPMDIAELISNIPKEDRVIVFRLLKKDVAIEVFEALEFENQQEFLATFPEAKVREIIEEMAPDDRAELLEELPAKVTKRLLLLLSPEEKAATNILLGYKENTAGRIMTPEFMDLKENMTLAQALNRIRRIGLKKETTFYCYVIDDQRYLKGVVSLRDMVNAEPDELIGRIMSKDPIAVFTDDDQEEVAEVFQKYNLLAVPVVDSEGRLVGIVTIDDIVDIVQEETTEDIYKMGAVSVMDAGYFQSNIFNIAGRRIIWLLVLLVSYTLSGSIILSYNQLLASVVSLTAFIPLLIDSGGNIGSQSSTVVIRSLALKEIETKDTLWVVFRESITGLMLGLPLGLIAIVWSYMLNKDLTVSLSVGLSLIAISTMASSVGSLLPFIFKFFKIDPALTSSPFIATIVDILGISIYLGLASLIILR